EPWFDTRLSYNPAIHRIKQAQFHCAVVSDLNSNPLPPPHPELLKYFEPPRKMLKKAKPVIEECQRAFNVKEGLYFSTFHLLFNLTLSFCFIVPKKVARQRKDGHVHAKGDDDEMILLDRKLP